MFRARIDAQLVIQMFQHVCEIIYHNFCLSKYDGCTTSSTIGPTLFKMKEETSCFSNMVDAQLVI